MRLLSILAGLGIGIAAPALAQEQDTVAPEVRQQIEAVTTRREEAYNKYDAAAWAALLHAGRDRCLDVVVRRWCGGRSARY
jgi:hypothetical protein